MKFQSKISKSVKFSKVKFGEGKYNSWVRPSKQNNYVGCLKIYSLKYMSNYFNIQIKNIKMYSAKYKMPLLDKLFESTLLHNTP